MKKYILYILFIFITCSFCFKCLAGYEYLSCIILFAASPFLYKFFAEKEKRLYYFKCFSIVCIAGICGFLIAFLIHADLRGDTLIQGIHNIYEQDIKRRTYGEAENFAAVYGPSLNASALDVVKKYVYGWSTEVLPGIPGKNFFLFISIGIISLCFTMKYHFSMEKEKFVAFIVYVLSPLSWYILGKSHSYIHTHLNFVLWYFGFIAVVMYCIFDGVKLFVRTVASGAGQTILPKKE